MSPNRPPPRLRDWTLALLWGSCAYLFHHWGNTTGMYVRHDWFQVAAHFWSATAMALILVVASRSLRLDGLAAVAFVVGLSAVGALGWELVEYLGIFENLHFWGFEDSLIDLIADAIGVSLVLVLTELPRAFDRWAIAQASPVDRFETSESNAKSEPQSVPPATADRSD